MKMNTNVLRMMPDNFNVYSKTEHKSTLYNSCQDKTELVVTLNLNIISCSQKLATPVHTSL